MHNNNIIYSAIFFLLLVLSVLFYLSYVSAASCWQYSSSSTCTTGNGCKWKNDSWGSWCEELSCWSLGSQSTCGSTNVPGKNCTWENGSLSYSCEELSCWSFSGTNQTQCESNSANKSCTWNSRCYNVGGGMGSSGTDCWSITAQATCGNTTGCAWGQCEQKSCYNYITNTSCNAGKDWKGKNCTWSGSGSYCKESNCYDYYNQSTCEGVTGINCEWEWGSCQEKACWSFDFTNESACVNNTVGKSCKWESNSYCRTDDCWNANTQNSCETKKGCRWKSSTSSNTCSEVNCWTWESSKGGNKSKCENEDATYGLNCIWSGNPASSQTAGWCYADISQVSCSNTTTERECYDTRYCWWQANSWSDPTLGGNCSNPTWGTGSFSGISGSVMNDWSPGCYIFDVNSTKCNSVLGCNYTNGACGALGDSYGVNISSNGLKCSYINESILCNNIPGLSSCCTWQNGTCTNDYYSTACISQISQKPNGEEACEDAKTFSGCNTIAGDPWYMPCKWDNSTLKCKFKATDVFGNSSQSIVKIENKWNCEAAGGKWITENYCEGGVAVPVGRCEYKFDDEDNCDKACFACENKDRNGNLINATNAESACLGSKLGFCTFTNDTRAPNRIGYCKAKEQWKKGIAGDCNSVCGDCNYLGNPYGNNSRDSAGNCLTPSCFCGESKANSNGGGCKWIGDNSTATNGYCLKKGEKTCLDACDRCKTKDKCANEGRSALNSTGSCKWQGSDNDGACVANIAGNSEICWDGIDNNDNGLIDCADSSCYSDSWCGFVEGDCFGWSDEGTCKNKGCEWVNDTWNQKGWCDFKGASCWKSDKSEATCLGDTQINETLNITLARLPGHNINESKTFKLNNLGAGWVVGSVSITNQTGLNLAGNFTVDYTAQTIIFLNNTFMINGGGNVNLTNVSYRFYANRSANCQWSNGSGTGGCERDWSITEKCFVGKNETQCNSITSCIWTNDTWCSGQGVSSEWCRTKGGWCDHVDFKPKECWKYNENSSCTGAQGCSWKLDTWTQARCEVNWTGNCWNYYANSSCTNAGCFWRNETFGGTNTAWCANKFDTCWSKSNSQDCAAVTIVSCMWRNSTTGNGNCEPACFNSTSQNSCSSMTGCMWKAENGWCQEEQSEACYNSTNAGNQTNCQSTTGCKWKNPGWCDPKGGGFSSASLATGGGVGGGMGSSCYKYDGNQSFCTNKTIINISCGWFPELNPKCDVDWSKNCWEYSSANSGCNVTNGCWWNPTGSFCANLIDQCWSNTSLQNNANACNANPYCNATSWGGCEATCFSKGAQSTCAATSGCRWISGWCNPSGMNELFTGMETGAPVPLGFDNCGNGEVNQSSVDICGFGMKDMGNGFGFGINVFDFSNASVCNKEKITSHVQQKFGGGSSGIFSDKVGDGNQTVIFFVYLDTDGNTNGGCQLSHNSSAEGYEFRFKYTSEWNATKQKAVETFNAYKCENSKWITGDIKLSAWNKIMCSEIGGAMIAVQKTDLTRFPDLYDSTKDIRVYVSTIGESNTGNVTNPTDTAGPGWVTLGSIDFEIFDAFSYGADSAKFEDILRKGFVQSEDCFNSADDDNDGNIDCNDWDCQFSSKCSTSGVNALSYIDTKTPEVTGVKIEEYSDSALVMYDTNKPANGTLEFYYNDSRCLAVNKSINDIGITSANVRDYKSWHTAEIYSSTLGYNLTNETTYYYRLRVCDDNAKCAVSKCSSFVTSSINKCGFCNFVTRIKVPSGWAVQYDINKDGIYEHIQGSVCGSNAGMKSNYTMRRVNIKLNNSDGTAYFEFINASLTKTGLNDKVRTISTSGSIIGDSTKVGLTSETRDKIINNLHPEVCRIKVPYSGTCNSLFHCDDNGANCVDRTSSSTLIDSTNCVWQVPSCEFSTYRESTSTDSGSSSSSGGGGGSTTSEWTKTIAYDAKEFKEREPITRELSSDNRITLKINNEQHHVGVKSIESDRVTIEVASTPQTAVLGVGEIGNFDINSDNYYDLSVRVNSIMNNKADITVSSISEAVPAVEEQEIVEEQPESSPVSLAPEQEVKGSSWWIYIIVILLVIIIIAFIIMKRRAK